MVAILIYGVTRIKLHLIPLDAKPDSVSFILYEKAKERGEANWCILEEH